MEIYLYNLYSSVLLLRWYFCAVCLCLSVLSERSNQSILNSKYNCPLISSDTVRTEIMPKHKTTHTAVWCFLINKGNLENQWFWGSLLTEATVFIHLIGDIISNDAFNRQFNKLILINYYPIKACVDYLVITKMLQACIISRQVKVSGRKYFILPYHPNNQPQIPCQVNLTLTYLLQYPALNELTRPLYFHVLVP